MKKIPLSDVLSQSTPDGKIVHKYKRMRLLQDTLYTLMNVSVVKETNINESVIALDKMYYVQDYQNNEFYYKCTEAFFEDLSKNLDEKIDSLISSVAGMVQVNAGLTTQMKSSKELIDSFKKKINEHKIMISEV